MTTTPIRQRALLASKGLSPVSDVADDLEDRQKGSQDAETHSGGLLPPPAHDNDGFMVALIPQDEDANDVSQFAAMDPSELHTTLVFYGDREQYDTLDALGIADALRAVALVFEPVEATLGGVTRFSGTDGTDPVVLSVDSKDVHAIRKMAMERLSDEFDIDEQTDHGYTPHMTLGYLPSDAPLHLAGWKAKKIVFDRIRVAFGDDQYDVVLGTGWGDKSVRRVRDSAYWGLPVGAIIPAGHRPAGRGGSNPAGIVVSNDVNNSRTAPRKKQAVKKAANSKTAIARKIAAKRVNRRMPQKRQVGVRSRPSLGRTVADFRANLTVAQRRDYDTLDERSQQDYRRMRGFGASYYQWPHREALARARNNARYRERHSQPRITQAQRVAALGPVQRRAYDGLTRVERTRYHERAARGRTHAQVMRTIERDRRINAPGVRRAGYGGAARRAASYQPYQPTPEELAAAKARIEAEKIAEKERKKKALAWKKDRQARKARELKPNALDPKKFPKSDGRYDQKSILDLDEDGLTAISHAFEVEVGDLRTEINLERSGINGHTIEVRGDIMFENRAVGNFERHVDFKSKKVYNALLEITNKDLQGQGFADALYDATESTMYQQGIRTVTVHANIDVGGYAWARRGFNFSHADTCRTFGLNLARQMDHWERVKNGTEDGPITMSYDNSDWRDEDMVEIDMALVPDSFIRAAKELAAKARRSPTSVTPNDFASLGEGMAFMPPKTVYAKPSTYNHQTRKYSQPKSPKDRTIPMHFGKAMMLGTDWGGIRKLDPSVVKKDVHSDWMTKVRSLYGMANDLFVPGGHINNPTDSDFNVMFLDLFVDSTMEEKDVRRVASAAGVRRFNLPIGSIIGQEGPHQLELPLDLPAPDPKLNKPRDFERMSKRPDLADVRLDYHHMVARWERVYDDEQTWKPNDTQSYQDSPSSKFSNDYGFDADNYGSDGIASAVAKGPWTYFEACKSIRRSAYDMLGFKSTDQAQTRGDAAIHAPSPGWGRGTGVNDPEVHAYALLKGVKESAPQDQTLYRGVQMSDPESFIKQLREGDTFDMPLASFSNSRDNTVVFGEDITFALQKGARAVEGGEMGTTPKQERQIEEGLAYYEDFDDIKEYVSGGRFKITGIRKNKKGWTVLIKQTAVFDPQTGVLQKAVNKYFMPTFSWMFDVPLARPRPRRQSKHLPGLHDQADHGKRGTVSSLAGRAMKGGFTFDLGKSVYPKNGHVIALAGTSDISKAKNRAECRNQMSRFIDKHKHEMGFIGGWYDKDNGEICLDVVVIEKDRERAMKLGKENNQQAIFDLTTGEVIDTGGTGDRDEYDIKREGLHLRATKQLGSDVAVRAGLLAGRMSGQDGGSYGLKDVYGGMAGLGRKPPRREMIERAKRSPLRVRARKVCNTTQKKEYPFDLDAYHLAAEDRSEYKRIAHVRTPAGVEKYGQPIGTLIVADGPGGAEDIIDNLKYEGRPYGPGWVVVSDGNGKHYDVGFDDEDTQKWVATSTEGGWDDVIVEGGESDSDIIRKLSAKLRKDGVPTIKEVEEAKKKAPAKRTNIRKKPAATTKSGKKKKTTITKKKAAGGLTLSKALARSGGDQTPEDKLDKEGYVFIDPNAPKVRVRQVLHKKTNTNRRNPADYFVRNGKPVHTDAQVDAAFLASGGTQAALDKARSEGRSPIRPAHNNKYLWIAKDPKGGVAYSAVAVIPATDRNGKKTYKVPPARYQLNSAGEPHRVAVQTKEMADANLMQKRAKIISLVAHIYKLDKALQKDMDNDPNAGAVALMRILGIRVNSKNEEDQAKQQKSPEKAERLRKLGIDPDQPIFGAATLQARHVRIDGDTVYIDFMGKELVRNTHAVRDPLLVKMLKKHMRGKRNNDPLFPGVDANTTKAYIQKHMGAGVTNKDLRDLAATHLAARYVSEMPAPKTQTEFDMLQAEVAYRVALTLNNKASESLGSYIAPPVWDTWKKALQT